MPMIGAKFGGAVNKTKQGQSCTEGLMYLVLTALLISAFVLIFEIVIPGRAINIPGLGDFFISHEFYMINAYYFNTFASMLGLVVAAIVIRFHKRSVEKRVLKFAKGLN